MKFLFLALLSLTALVSARSVLRVVEEFDGLTGSVLSRADLLKATPPGLVPAAENLVSSADLIIEDALVMAEGFRRKRGYPAARRLSAARVTLSDAEAKQVAGALTSFVSAEKALMIAISAEAANLALVGQAEPMSNSLSNLQQAIKALLEVVAPMIPTRADIREALVEAVKSVADLLPLVRTGSHT